MGDVRLDVGWQEGWSIRSYRTGGPAADFERLGIVITKSEVLQSLSVKGVTIKVLPSGDCLALEDIYNITNGLL